MVGSFTPLVVCGLILASGQGVGRAHSPSRKALEAVQAFGMGGEEYHLLRWKEHLLVYRLHRGLPVLVSPETLTFPGEGLLDCRTAHGTSRIPPRELQAHLLQRLLIPEEGQRLFAGCLRTRQGRGSRVHLQEADVQEERESGPRIPLSGFQGALPQRPVVILGTLEESPVTPGQMNEPLLHVLAWTEI